MYAYAILTMMVTYLKIIYCEKLLEEVFAIYVFIINK